MSTPLSTFNKAERETNFLNWEPANVPLNPVANAIAANSPYPALANFKYTGQTSDHKLFDYLVLGLVSILIHATVVDHFDRLSLSEEIIQPVEQPPKVMISLSRPQPKTIAPPPKLQAKPPTPKVVPLKPQKPKPVEKVLEPTPAPAPVVDSTPSPAPAVSSPAPVVEEKITAPVAGADYLHNPAPEYPEIAMDRGWEGKVLMKVHVKPDGKPDEVSVIKSSGQKILDDAAVKTVNKWSFVPAMRGTTPIAGWVTVPITFNLS